MMLINAVKTVCDLLLYFTFAALFEPYSGAWEVMATVLLLAFLSSLILQKLGGTIPARILCGLLPAAGLFMAKDLTEILVTAVALAFYFALTLAGRNEIHYDEYMYWFGIPAVPVVTALFVCVIKWPIRPVSAICAGLYLFLGILVLREKRMGAGAGPKLRLLSLAEQSGVVVITVIVCVLLFVLLKHSGKVLEILLLPFGLLFNGLVSLFNWLQRLSSLFLPKIKLPEIKDEPNQGYDPFAGTNTVDPEAEAIASQTASLIQIIGIILAVVILLFIIYKFYKFVRNVSLEETGAAAIEEGTERPTIFRRRRSKRKKRSGSSNSEKIRRIYKEYLYCAKVSGIELAPQTTSADVLAASDQLIAHEEAERLRELYIRARYHDTEEMSSLEVEEAKTLLAFIRGQFEAEKSA